LFFSQSPDIVPEPVAGDWFSASRRILFFSQSPKIVLQPVAGDCSSASRRILVFSPSPQIVPQLIVDELLLVWTHSLLERPSKVVARHQTERTAITAGFEPLPIRFQW
jgi:hypothetical protein